MDIILYFFYIKIVFCFTFYISIVIEVNIYITYMVMIFLICKKNYKFNHSSNRPCSSYPCRINFHDSFSVIHGLLCFWSLFFIPLIILSTLWLMQFFSFTFFTIWRLSWAFLTSYFNINFRIWINSKYEYLYAQIILRFGGGCKKNYSFILLSSEYKNWISLCF